MASTIATQLRRAQVSNLKAQYAIDMLITDRGDLPAASVFLMEIVDEQDPKDDVLARVCTVADMETFRINRASAITAGDRFYRSITASKFYSSVDVAIKAKDFLIEQVNALVTEYASYLTGFKADPAEIIVFPMVNAGILGPAIAAYTAKAAEADDQAAVILAKQTDCAELTAQYNAALAHLQSTKASLDALLLANQVAQDLTGAAMALTASLDNVSAEIIGTIDAWTAASPVLVQPDLFDDMNEYLDVPTGRLYAAFHTEFTPVRRTFAAGVQNATAQLALVSAAATAQTSAVAAQQSSVDTLFTAKETCALEVAQAQQVLSAIVQERTRLLGVVKDLCPAFTP
jgi:hypothetical protein